MKTESVDHNHRFCEKLHNIWLEKYQRLSPNKKRYFPLPQYENLQVQEIIPPGDLPQGDPPATLSLKLVGGETQEIPWLNDIQIGQGGVLEQNLSQDAKKLDPSLLDSLYLPASLRYTKTLGSNVKQALGTWPREKESLCEKLHLIMRRDPHLRDAEESLEAEPFIPDYKDLPQVEKEEREKTVEALVLLIKEEFALARLQAISVEAKFDALGPNDDQLPIETEKILGWLKEIDYYSLQHQSEPTIARAAEETFTTLKEHCGLDNFSQAYQALKNYISGGRDALKKSPTSYRHKHEALEEVEIG